MGFLHDLRTQSFLDRRRRESEREGIIIIQNKEGGRVMRNKVIFGIFFLTCILFASSASAAPVTGVVINLANLGLEVGQTGTLVATVLPAGDADDPTVTWASSAPAVAFVNQNGQVVGFSEGSAVITATTNTGGFVASCFVTIGRPTVPVTGVDLDKTSLILGVGQTSTLVAAVAPANATGKHVTWASSDPAVATVDITGQVRGVTHGTARITVTTVDGGFTAFCDVEVEESLVPVTGVSLDRTALSLSVGQT
ncbi:MAG: hypothetical protein EOM51_11695, partial [Clostridia bacterium]|nr:hypothetical protein [Clostridia bacterium]